MIDWKEFIESNPSVMTGKPVFTGTRITVEFVLERLAQGATDTDLLNHYVGLRQEHLRAALAYAAAVVRRDEVVFNS